MASDRGGGLPENGEPRAMEVRVSIFVKEGRRALLGMWRMGIGRTLAVLGFGSAVFVVVLRRRFVKVYPTPRVPGVLLWLTLLQVLLWLTLLQVPLWLDLPG